MDIKYKEDLKFKNNNLQIRIAREKKILNKLRIINKNLNLFVLNSFALKIKLVNNQKIRKIKY